MNAYRTSSLFHYTSFKSLRKILEEGLIPNYCKEDYSDNENPYFIGVPMVSFCDIPITRTKEFIERYGHHAIGLSREWAMTNDANPVLYSHINNTYAGLQFLKSYEMSNLQAVRQAGGNDKSLPIRVGANGQIPGMKEFINRVNATNAVISLFGYVKKFYTHYHGKTIVCYEENEWRYVVSPTDQIQWLWGENEYVTWRGKGKTKPEPSDALKSGTLKFKVDDITNIIIEKESQILPMINIIKNMEHVGGNSESLTENDKMKLISKLISLERIERDF